MALKKRNLSATEQILEALEERGYRSTAPRRTLAAAIGVQKRHFTAEGLRRQLPPTLGRATVYRTLKLLVEAGVLCRVMLEDGDLHYQLSHRGHHHHLLCVLCGSSPGLDRLRHRGLAGRHFRPPRLQAERPLAGSLRPLPRLHPKRTRRSLVSFFALY